MPVRVHWAQSTFENDGWRRETPQISGMRNTRICGRACCLATFALYSQTDAITLSAVFRKKTPNSDGS